MEDRAIRITYDGKSYELTYNRETVRQMEKSGFDISALARGQQPATMMEMLFQGGFLARHRKTKARVIAEIYEHVDNKQELIGALAELYAATLETLTDTSDSVDGKKVTWEAI